MKVHLNHIALLVTNLETARNFYGNILGLEEIERPPFIINGLWYGLGEISLHLMLYEQAISPQAHPLNETVQPHFALSFTSNEIMDIIVRLKKSDVQFIEEPTKQLTEKLQIFFYDFDRNMIEINNFIEI